MKSVTITDLSGRALTRTNTSGSRLEISLRDLPSGVYILEVRSAIMDVVRVRVERI